MTVAGNYRRRRSFNPGRWLVQRQRVHLDLPAPPRGLADAVAIGSALPPLLQKLGLDGRQWLTRLAAEWPSVVGPAVARHTRPGRMEGDRLVVFVDHSVWLNELARYGKAAMLSNLQRSAGADRIKTLTLELDPDAR
jgi:predicted nucleic acid-binding Zn ribbon protein